MVSAIAALLLPPCPAVAEKDPPMPAGPKPEDAEVRLVLEETSGDVTIRQYAVKSMAQLAYVIACGGEAVVVDPIRDVHPYLEDIRTRGLRLTAVLLTHTHADFVAGHTEIASRVEAPILISSASPIHLVSWTCGSEWRRRRTTARCRAPV